MTLLMLISQDFHLFKLSRLIFQRSYNLNRWPPNKYLHLFLMANECQKLYVEFLVTKI